MAALWILVSSLVPLPSFYGAIAYDRQGGPYGFAYDRVLRGHPSPRRPPRSPRAGARSTSAGARVVRWCSSSWTAAGPTRPARTPRPAPAATTPGPRPRTGRSPNAVARAATARSRCGRVIRRPALSRPPRPWSRLTVLLRAGAEIVRAGRGGTPPSVRPAFAISAACDSIPVVQRVVPCQRRGNPASIGKQEDRSCRPRARDCPASPPFAPSRSFARAASRCSWVRPSIGTTPRRHVVSRAHARGRRGSRTTRKPRKRCRSMFAHRRTMTRPSPIRSWSCTPRPETTATRPRGSPVSPPRPRRAASSWPIPTTCACPSRCWRSWRRSPRSSPGNGVSMRPASTSPVSPTAAWPPTPSPFWPRRGGPPTPSPPAPRA